MNKYQKEKLFELYINRLSEKEFLSMFDFSRIEMPNRLSEMLIEAIETKSRTEVEMGVHLGFTFGFASNIVNVLNELVILDWHTTHDQIVHLLKDFSDESSIPYLKETIKLKPNLSYLDYDDYGSYYKVCLWALADIGTKESFEAIKAYRNSNDEALRKEAIYRYEKIKKYIE
ncbi:hypothetical protein AB3N59_13400 [Leptospira sp. WS92.C1]